MCLEQRVHDLLDVTRYEYARRFRHKTKTLAEYSDYVAAC